MQAFGFDLNFGNIPPDDAVSLATLRTGLRGDTFADIHLAGVPVYLDVGVHGALEARERGGVVVLIDALRASATIVTALGCGMRAVRPVASPEECVGEITAGERGGRKLPHVRHANSPTELESCNYTGKTLVLTSTNGVECLLTVAGPSTAVLVGSTINRTAVAREAYARARDQGVSITLLMAGRNNRPAREDSLAAGEILRAMPGPVHLHGLAPAASDGLEAEFFDCESGRNLVELGYSADVRRCAQVDLYEAVPVLAAGELVLSDWSG
jgi:phosphosulfolactate phosphohydrolase-like enzyme